MTFKVGNTEINAVSLIEPYGDDLPTVDFELEGPWVRPSAWLDMPTFASGEDKAAILAFFPSGSTDISAQIYTRGFYASGYKTYTTIDWGDGTTSVASGSSTDWRNVNYIAPQVHIYNYDDLPPESEFMRGGLLHRQALIVLDGSVSGIEYIGLNEFNNGQRVGYANNYQTMPVLDIHVECPNIKYLYIYGNQFNYPRNVERLVINATGEFLSPDSLCYDMQRLRVFEMPYADTSSVTSFANMFAGCRSLQSVPYFDTSSATRVEGMFSYTYSLTGIPNYNFSNVDRVDNFLNSSNLDYIPDFDYSNVTNFAGAFAGMFNLKTFPSGVVDFSKATMINSILSSCRSLEYIPNDFFQNMTGVTSADSAFYLCDNLKSMPRIDLPSCTNMRRFAQNCHQLRKIHLGDLRSMPNGPYNNNANFRESFNACYNLESVKVDYPDETWASGMYNMFGACINLREAPNINLSKAYWVGAFLSSCHSLVEAPVYDLSNAIDYQSFYSSCAKLRRVGGFRFGNRKANTGRQCFYRCYRLEEFPSGLFQDYYSTPVDLYQAFRETNISKMPSITTSGITNSQGSAFAVMYGLQDIENVTFASGDVLPGLFANNTLLQMAGSWDVSGVQDLTSAFNTCRSLYWSDLRNTSCNIGYYDCFLSSGALEHIFNNLVSGVVGKTIDIRLNYGTAQLSASTLAIATDKGWTVTT